MNTSCRKKESLNSFTIYNSLPHGKKNAVSADHLCALYGLRSKRELRKQIQSERMAGALIASGDTGYFIPDDRTELLEYVHRYEQMAKSMFAMLKFARATLKEYENQTELNFE